MKNKINNLRYRRPTLFVALIAAVFCIIIIVCLILNIKQKSEFMIKMRNSSDGSVSYVYLNPSHSDSATLTLNAKENKFVFCVSLLSSFIATGTYETKNNELYLKTDDGLYEYVFQRNVSEKGTTYVFCSDKSSNIPKLKYSSNSAAHSPLPNGAAFVLNQ